MQTNYAKKPGPMLGVPARVQRCRGLRATEPGAVDAVKAFLEDEDSYVRSAACEWILRAKLPASAVADVLPALLHLLADESGFVRKAASSALARLPAASLESHVDVLADLLVHQDCSVRKVACQALSKLSSEAIAPHASRLGKLLEVEELEEAACTIMAKLPQNLLVTHLQRLSESMLRLPSEVAEEFVDIVSFAEAQDPEVQRATISIVHRWSHSGWVKALSHQQDLVRAAACRAIVKMPGSVLTNHEKLLTGLLQDWNSSVRASACFALGHLPANALLPHAGRLASMLDDLQYEVRQEACLAAAKLPQGALAPRALAARAPKLEQLMQDDDEGVRMAACRAVARLPQDVMVRHAVQISNALHGFPSLAQEFHGISGWLQHGQLAVREAACSIMTMWPSEMVGPHIALVAQFLEVEPLQWIACVLMAKLPGHLLVPHIKSLSMKVPPLGSDVAEQFVDVPSLLDHGDDPEVRAAACSIMGLWAPAMLRPYGPKLERLLEDPCELVWQAACSTLAPCHLSGAETAEAFGAWTRLDPWAAAALRVCSSRGTWPQQILDALTLQVDSLGSQHANQLLSHLVPSLMSSDTLELLGQLLKKACGCSWPPNRHELLHAAARAGNHEVCEVLVNNGHPLRVKDRSGLTPEEHAIRNGHHTVASWFRQHLRLVNTRGGSGAAYYEAMQDESAVVKVQWHQIELDGVPGRLGGIHSLLAITVRNGQSQSSWTYVLEKAASQREDAREECQNGIYISCWSEVTSMITLPALHTLNSVGAALTMKKLWEVAMSTGKYDLTRSNCHHAAQAVYNACVPHSDPHLKVLKIPNALLTSVAALVKPLLLGSRSSTSQSSSVAVSSELGESGSASRINRGAPFPFEMVGEAGRVHPGHLKAAYLAKWVYQLRQEELTGLGGLLNIHLHVLRRMGDENPTPVQWAVLEDEDAFYVTFKGTDNFVDVVIDFDLTLRCFCDMRVHNGISGGLQHKPPDGKSVLDELEECLGSVSVQNAKEVILCGHSLGGGYAILAALFLLYRGFRVTQVVTFGAPQVLVPDMGSPGCRWLDEITTLYVNAWDPVPRLPACLEWLELLARIRVPLAGFIHVCPNLQDTIDKFKRLRHGYGLVGRLAFVAPHSSSIRCGPCLGEVEWLLYSPPPEEHGTCARRLCEFHLMDEYVKILKAAAES
ncbi:unnamed protein product [Durusdinium trenchii]|uniref:Fungal lipase-type domain-containing protein n=2 Tax=Durusdinium trenchii TaxID=1381693 RepID=A0ABP0PGR7_9DINO